MPSAAIARPQSWNRYAYVSNDPVNRVDPSGLEDGVITAPDPPPPVDPGLPGLASFDLMLMAMWQAQMQQEQGHLFLAHPVGGRGNDVVTLQHMALNRTLRKQAAGALDNLKSPCKDAITKAGINLERVKQTAASTEYYNAASLEGSWFVSNITGYQTPDNLAMFLGGARARLLVNRWGEAMNSVVVGSSFLNGAPFGTVENSQNITLIHEALHTGTGYDDPALAKTLGLGSFKNDQIGISAASQSISTWLAYDCPPVP
jgi:hypothetical protein